MTAHPFRPGDRVVWTGTPGGPVPPLEMAGTYVADGPAPFVTVHHDGWERDAQVFADQLTPWTEGWARTQDFKRRAARRAANLAEVEAACTTSSDASDEAVADLHRRIAALNEQASS